MVLPLPISFFYNNNNNIIGRRRGYQWQAAALVS
jgi:hypothetical protein